APGGRAGWALAACPTWRTGCGSWGRARSSGSTSRAGSVVSRTPAGVTVTFAGSGDAFGSGGRLQACIHLQPLRPQAPVLLDCGATSLPALRRCGLDPGAIAAVFVSPLPGAPFAGLPFLIPDAPLAP